MGTSGPPGEPEGGWAALHERFLQSLRRCRTFEVAVAVRLLDAGLAVSLPPLREAPDVMHKAEFSDTGDILVESRWVVEVKSSGYSFTGPDDWPFSYGAFIAARTQFERRHPPVAYVAVSQQTLGMVAIPSSTRPDWRLRRTRNTEGHEYDVVCAPRHTLRSIDALIAALVERKEAA